MRHCRGKPRSLGYRRWQESQTESRAHIAERNQKVQSPIARPKAKVSLRKEPSFLGHRRPNTEVKYQAVVVKENREALVTEGNRKVRPNAELILRQMVRLKAELSLRREAAHLGSSKKAEQRGGQAEDRDDFANGNPEAKVNLKLLLLQTFQCLCIINRRLQIHLRQTIFHGVDVDLCLDQATKFPKNPFY